MEINVENKVFIHDKKMPKYVYLLINLVMLFIDVWHWTLLFIERFNTRQEADHIKKYYLSICAIFKNEELSMKEWIEYHLLIGVDHFYLYDNNSTDRCSLVLKPYIEKGIVTLNEWNLKAPCQADAYNHCKSNYWNDTRWLAFIDLDEYICPRFSFDIKNFLSKFESYPSLIVYWKMFGSSGLVVHDNKRLITEQYYIAWDKFNDIGKPFFNTRFTPCTTTIKYIHQLPAEMRLFGMKFIIPPINEFKWFVRFRSNRVGCFKNKNDFSIQINHYVLKSYNEYFVRRRNRGDVNSFANNASIKNYEYVQKYANVPDYSIFKFIPYLKVLLSDGKYEKFF